MCTYHISVWMSSDCGWLPKFANTYVYRSLLYTNNSAALDPAASKGKEVFNLLALVRVRNHKCSFLHSFCLRHLYAHCHDDPFGATFPRPPCWLTVSVPAD
jgi:hypothetical protein